MIGHYLWCNLPVWCSCRTCINHGIRQGCATCGLRAKCNKTKWIFMPVTSTRQPVWNEGAARGLICLIAFGPSVTKVAQPWYTTICETGSLINACDLHPDDHRTPGGRCQQRTQKIFMGGFIQWHMVVICVWCALFVTSQFDVIFMFSSEVCWHNRHYLLHTLSLFL